MLRNLDFFKKLFENYKLYKHYVLNKRIDIGEKGKCRYCNKTNKEVTFRKVAHSFPELIGNKFLFSFDECDECNSYFDKYLENNLANFLGISRTLCQVKGKKGIPKYKSSEEERIEVIGHDFIIIQNHDSNLVDLNDEQKTINFNHELTQYKYIPINVYKCFLKMALSILPPKELKMYKNCINWVRFNKIPDKFDTRLLKMHCTFIPGNLSHDIQILLYKRTGDRSKYLNLTCVLFFDNYIFYFIIPSFGKDDKDLKIDAFDFIFPFNVDLTSSELITNSNDASMRYIGDWKENIPLEEIPEDIKKRIKGLGLTFQKDKNE